jgi:hypothetical protein
VGVSEMSYKRNKSKEEIYKVLEVIKRWQNEIRDEYGLIHKMIGCLEEDAIRFVRRAGPSNFYAMDMDVSPVDNWKTPKRYVAIYSFKPGLYQEHRDFDFYQYNASAIGVPAHRINCDMDDPFAPGAWRIDDGEPVDFEVFMEFERLLREHHKNKKKYVL